MYKTGVLVLLLCGIFMAAQRASAQQPRLPPSIAQPQGMGDTPVVNADVQKQQAIIANQQRQLELRRDTEKMAKLTQELREYLDQKDTGVISVDAMKKAEQIEKLAKSVRSKMKQTF